MRLLEWLGRTPQPVVCGMLNAVLWAGGGVVYLILVIWPQNVVG
jgi:hypothetical protein